MYRLALLFPLLLLLLVAVACNGGEEETPEGTPAPTAISEESIPRAIVPANPGEFEEQVLGGKTLTEKRCMYLRNQTLVDCGAEGVYKLGDPVVGASPVCNLLSDESKPLAIVCTTSDPDSRVVYAIQ